MKSSRMRGAVLRCRGRSPGRMENWISGRARMMMQVRNKRKTQSARTRGLVRRGPPGQCPKRRPQARWVEYFGERAGGRLQTTQAGSWRSAGLRDITKQSRQARVVMEQPLSRVEKGGNKAERELLASLRGAGVPQQPRPAAVAERWLSLYRRSSFASHPTLLDAAEGNGCRPQRRLLSERQIAVSRLLVGPQRPAASAGAITSRRIFSPALEAFAMDR